jgi:hypothetical protein
MGIYIPTMKDNFADAKLLWEANKDENWVVDVLMQGITDMVKKYKQANEEDAEISVLDRIVETTGEMLKDMKEAIRERREGIDSDVKRSEGLSGYHGSNPFEDDD